MCNSCWDCDRKVNDDGMREGRRDGMTERANTICPSHFVAGHKNQVVQSCKTATSQKCPFWIHKCWRPVVGSKYFWRIPQFKHCTDTLAWQIIIYRKKIAIVTQYELEEAVWCHRGACRVYYACYKMNRQHGHQKTREDWGSIRLKHYSLGFFSAFIQGKILLDLIKIQ